MKLSTIRKQAKRESQSEISNGWFHHPLHAFQRHVFAQIEMMPRHEIVTDIPTTPILPHHVGVTAPGPPTARPTAVGDGAIETAGVVVVVVPACEFLVVMVIQAVACKIQCLFGFLSQSK